MRTNPSAGDSTAVLDGSQRDIGDYMAQEVMSQLPPELRRFLYATSLIDRFCPDLAEAIRAAQRLGLG